MENMFSRGSILVLASVTEEKPATYEKPGEL